MYLHWIRTRLAFSILRSALLCLRGIGVSFYAPLKQQFKFVCMDAHLYDNP